MTRNEHIKLLAHIAGMLLISDEMSFQSTEGSVEQVVALASKIVQAAVVEVEKFKP
jgi:hypothetical protein